MALVLQIRENASRGLALSTFPRGEAELPSCQAAGLPARGPGDWSLEGGERSAT